MTPLPEFLRAADFAPGDAGAARTAWEKLALHEITDPDDPRFEEGYALLTAEFAARGELEARDVLMRRLQWDHRVASRGGAMRYRMMMLLADGTCVGLRDHTALLASDASAVIVHLSHSLVVPAWRRRGLSAILRTLPLRTARECVAATGRPEVSTTLVAEMDPWQRDIPERVVRMQAYEKAGFLKVEPCIAYRQPDFRSPSTIDAEGGPRLLPLELIIRRVGREAERQLPATEAAAIVRALYEMYAVEFREQDMRPCFERLQAMQGRTAAYDLIRPTEDAE